MTRSIYYFILLALSCTFSYSYSQPDLIGKRLSDLANTLDTTQKNIAQPYIKTDITIENNNLFLIQCHRYALGSVDTFWSTVPIDKIKKINVRKSTSIVPDFEPQSRFDRITLSITGQDFKRKKFGMDSLITTPYSSITIYNLYDSSIIDSIAYYLEALREPYKPDCEEFDTIILDTGKEFYGLYDSHLISKSTVNGQVDKSEFLRLAIQKNFEKANREAKFNEIDVRILINEIDEIIDVKNYGHEFYKIYKSEITKDTSRTKEEAMNLFDILDETDHSLIMEVLESQIWKAALCDNQKVPTIVNLRIDFK